MTNTTELKQEPRSGLSDLTVELYPIKSIKINGLKGTWSEISARYDYTKDKCKCAACGDIGIPWGGWFSCERCTAKALVHDGRVFINDDPQYAGL